MIAPAAAQSPDRWMADDTAARATLPLPRDNAKVTAAALSCDAQKWTLRLEINESSGLVPGEGQLVVDRASFAVPVTVDAGALAVAVPREALEPLKDGIRMTLDLAGAAEAAIGDAGFPLRGSRVAITAAEERCPPRDMSAYQPVTFTPYSSYMNLAHELRRDDINAFAASTTAQPKLDAAMVEFEQGRRILFVRLCGSSWYYGASGCNITGFAPQPPEANTDNGTQKANAGEATQRANAGDAKETDAGAAQDLWRAVYDSENVHLHTDPKSDAQGWWDIVTLPIRGAGPGRVFRWDGDGYAFKSELAE